MPDGAELSNYILAAGTIVAAAFVAVQAYYARSSYVENEATRFLERRLDICFENFDAAARLDASLRLAVPGMASQTVWPPLVRVENATELAALKREAVPKLDALEAGLTKARVLEGLDKHRAFLAQQARGLSKAILDLTPDQLAPDNAGTKATLSRLSDFLGAQYSVFTGCRLIAEGKV